MCGPVGLDTFRYSSKRCWPNRHGGPSGFGKALAGPLLPESNTIIIMEEQGIQDLVNIMQAHAQDATVMTAAMTAIW